MNAIEFTNVWKKFRKGEKFSSLRDAIPHMFKNIAAKNAGNNILEESEFWAVNDVSFSIGSGEVVGFIGSNGAGKSTILKLLSGIIVPNKGHLKVNGRLSALIEVTAGFHPELTGRENVYLNGTILGMKKREVDERFDEIVEFSGIEEFIDTPVKRYSSGMYSRLGFSVAAHVNPDVLLVDEVLAVGDIAFQSKCAEKMRELLNSGVTIIFVSHNLPLVQSLCKRVFLIDRGAILKDGIPEDVIPYYEDAVLNQREEEIRKKSETDYKVKLNEKSQVQISAVQCLNKNGETKESFESGEELTLKVSYESSKDISHPILSLQLIRADGVVCFTSNTKDSGVVVDKIQGSGAFLINLGKLNLAPGIYLPQVTIWDKDMIHPYVINKKCILRINNIGVKQYANAVFIPKVEWKI